MSAKTEEKGADAARERKTYLEGIPKIEPEVLGSFRAYRELLDSIRPRRQHRGKQRPRDFRHSEGESKHNLGDFSTMTDAAMKLERQRLLSIFPRPTIDLKTYGGINQGQDGACTLVSIVHLFWLSEAAHLLSRSRSQLMRSWRDFWKPTDSMDASPDIASTIDMCMRTGLIPSAAALNYVPIRSEGNREQSFNEGFWTKRKSVLIKRYNIYPPSDYDKVPYVYQNAFLIENLLDEGCPVAVNALEHSRVAVAYNDTHLLFADSWGNYHRETNKTGSDVTSAGFSIVDKWLIYSWMRDIAYIDRATAAESSPAKRRHSRRHSRRRSKLGDATAIGASKKKLRTTRSTARKSSLRSSVVVDLTAAGGATVEKDSGEYSSALEHASDGEISSWIAVDEFREDYSSDET